MIITDINNLKQINDTYGHETGDQYIINCCKIICDTLKHSPVYRIGGDEFAVILLNDDYTNRQTLYKNLNTKFKNAFNDKTVELYKRYSASSGMSEKDATHTTIESIFEQADKNMYQNKIKFKEKYGTYR